MVLLTITSYISERTSRLNFKSSRSLLLLNSKLETQLKGLETSFVRIPNLESPLEKAITGVKLLLTLPHTSGSQISILQDILLALNSSNLTSPDLIRQLRSGNVIMDVEEEVWYSAYVLEMVV